MYRPRQFAEADTQNLHALMRAYGFATLVTAGEGAPVASHLPLLIAPEQGAFGTLVGHMARANPQWRGFGNGREALAVFQGAHAYVSPSWYATVPAVPTWNYAAVHAYGAPGVVEDHDAALAILARLVATHEAGLPDPWSIDRLPAEFRDTQVRGIVAFEMPIARLEGNFKLSQNKPHADRRDAAAGLRATGDPLALEVARMMDERAGGALG